MFITTILVSSFIIIEERRSTAIALTLKAPLPQHKRQWQTHCITSLPSFQGVGVTSISSIHSASVQKQSQKDINTSTCALYSIHVGTKRGSLKRITWSDANADADPDLAGGDHLYSNLHVHDYDHANKFTLKPYPIYSMIYLDAPQDNQILCGGGDRYITVWKNVGVDSTSTDTRISSTTSVMNGKCQVVSQLGPHTGWVKDMVYYSPSSPSSSSGIQFLFSIGCNCIEIWKMSVIGDDGGIGTSKPKSNSDHCSWQHDSKLEIDSSLEMGCTLSSDLLCLGLGICKATSARPSSQSQGRSDIDSHTRSAFLFAGGVDGRLHRWNMDGNGNESGNGSFKIANAESISAHCGRVSGILVCQVFNALISIGSDGMLLCKNMDNNLFKEWIGASLDLNQAMGDFMEKSTHSDTDSTVKISSLCCLRENINEVTLALGFTSGLAVLVELHKYEGGSRLNVVDDSIVEVEKGSYIYALKSIHKATYLTDGQMHDSYCITAGTSNGLYIWELAWKGPIN